MPYIGKVAKGMAMSLHPKIDIVDTWTFDVVWKREVDGKEEHACSVGSCSLRDTRAKSRLQAKLDDYVQRYAAYAKARGIRYEVKQREKRERLRAKEKAALEARRLVAAAGPDLLAAMKAMLANAENAGELAKAAIAKAEG